MKERISEKDCTNSEHLMLYMTASCEYVFHRNKVSSAVTTATSRHPFTNLRLQESCQHPAAYRHLALTLGTHLLFIKISVYSKLLPIICRVKWLTIWMPK